MSKSAAVSSTGVYYAASGGNLWSYASGTWKELISGNNGGQGIQAVAVNPSNPNEIVAVAASGYLNISYNAGSTWTGLMWSSNEVTSADIPWLADAQQVDGGTANYLSLGGAAFNPANPSQMILTGGTGVWTTTQVPTSGATQNTTVTWTDQTVGIENVCSQEILVPPGGDPILVQYDRPFFVITNPNAYPSTYGPVDQDTITAGFSADYASSDPSFVVGLADWYGVEASGYSTNGGQTWTKFATDIPGADSSFIGGTIAASTPQNIIWAPADGYQPYYTLNGGTTWNPITLPGVTSWTNFDFAWYLDQRSVTADRVLANTFYLYYPDVGVFSTTNGGQSWTKVYSGAIGPDDGFNSTLMSVPGEASNLFYTGGPVGTPSTTPANEPFYRSTNGGATWTTVPNVLDVFAFGFGAAAPGQSYPAIYIAGYVNNVYGIWQSTNNAQSWTNIGTFPLGETNPITTISGNPNEYGEVYIGFHGGGYAYLSATSTTGPTVTAITDSPATGDLNAGRTVALTLSFSELVTVAGGTPTLTLNDGGTATYASGSGTSALTFDYTVAAGQNVASLAATALNLPTGVTIEDSSGNAANPSLSGLTQSGPQIDTTIPVVSAIANSPASGDLNAGKTVALTLSFSEAVTVAGGTPTLTLNDGGTATYASGSGTNALTFDTTVAAGQNVGALAATALNLPTGVTIADGAGNAASLSLSGLTQSGPQIDTTAPTVTAISDSPETGDLNAGKTVAVTLSFSENVTVAGGTPTLTLNDGGTATYASGSGTTALTFNYTVAAGQNTPDLMVSAVNLNSASIDDSAGNAANLSLSSVAQSSPQIDTTTPTVTAIADSPASGDLNAGKTVALTLSFSEAVTVAGGTPTLTLNDGGTATYASGSGTNALVFNYTVAAGQNTAALAATALNLPTGVTIADGAGNAASLSLSGLTQSGPQIDTTTPAVTAIADSPSTGDLNAGKIVALTLSFSESVTVVGGTPTLTLNDGGTATYASGSGTSALTFDYTVAAGQNVATLAATALNLPSGVTIEDSSGNAANLSLSGLTQTGPQIDTTTPTVTAIADSPASGDLNAGKTVALTLSFSEAVTVAGGTPTLTLNDGGTATYASGSGTNALTFDTTVAAGQNVGALAATALNLPTGVTIADGAGNAASLSLSGLTQSGPQIDTTTPSVTGVTASPGTGTETVGNEITFTVSMSEAVSIAGGTPTLTLNDGGTATYASGSGTNALTFTYTVGSTDSSVSSIAITVVNVPTGVTITDGAGNAANMAGALATFMGLSVDPPVITVAAYLANQAALDAAGNIAIADTAANVSGSFDTLSADGHVTAITFTDTGTPTLSLTVAQALNDTRALGAITNASYAIAVADTAANVAANLNALNADSSVTSIALSDMGTPALTLTAAEALSDGTALAKITTPYTITISDTAANIENLTPTQIASFGSLRVSQIAANDASVALTVAQAEALEKASIPLSAPTGSLVTVSDTAANLQALTTTQILALSDVGVVGLNSDNANVTFSAAQTSAMLSAHLSVSAAGTYSVTEKFTSGAVISSSNQGTSAGALTLSTSANGLTVNVGASSLSVSAGTETIPLNPHTTETITATSRTKDSFVFTPGFGNDTIVGFAATGTNHDVIQFSASTFSYLTSGMTQAQDLAAVLSHVTSSGGATTISDSAGDTLALNSISVSTLKANPADFKFV